MEVEVPKIPHESIAIGEDSPGSGDSLLIQRRCCCCIPIFSSNRSRTTVGSSWWESTSTAENGDRWWTKGVRALKKLREWSEIAAGPRWKTFIRRFNRTRSGGGSRYNHAKFQYDPLSYSLNFDEGSGQNGQFDEEEVYGTLRNFSVRYASVQVPVNG